MSRKANIKIRENISVLFLKSVRDSFAVDGVVLGGASQDISVIYMLMRNIEMNLNAIHDGMK